jgi:triosephosphate isomerase (TIM)
MIIGNWKMYKTGSEAKSFILSLIPLIENTSKQAFLAVPFTSIQEACEAARGSRIVIGAQNMHDAEEGAFTGEVSASMLTQAGAQFVILGHSERRHLFFETNAFIHRKIKSALKAGLTPILCIGETEEERKQGRTKEVLTRQLKECLGDLTESDIMRLAIAYEPVWAIGTGQSATPAMAQETHALIREHLPKKIPILYGGSVKPDNAEALLSQPDINGALVGGASLNVETFVRIIEKDSL